jgi:NTE family protein
MAIALLLGGGAPTLTLQSGALAALHEKGVRFDVISAAGAGMVIGLLSVAPRGVAPRQALENTREMGVHDLIYKYFPVNFKVFHKPGVLADAYRSWLQSLPRLTPGQDDWSRFVSDWMQLWFATWCPSDLWAKSLGLCDHAPWIDEVVDFEKLKEFPGEFYMNAWCIEEQDMHIFDKHQITPDHFRAALAFPLIYPPFKLTVGGKTRTYIEGSAIDTLNFDGIINYYERRVDKKERLDPLQYAVVFDILSARNIIREPRSLYEAWIQSIMIPLVEIAEEDIRVFEQGDMKRWVKDKKNVRNIKREKNDNKEDDQFLLKVQFDIPEEHWPYVLDWSYSNLSKLYDIGYQAGLKFYDDHGEKLKRAAGQVARAQLDIAA